MAYACEPLKGSEPGAGWMWARMLARHAEVSVVTRANNRDAIEAVLPQTPEGDRMRFEYVDLPRRWTRWKKGQRGIRLYYLLWQRAALRRVRALHATAPFDLGWHVTLANAWLGSTLSALGITWVFGPVGGGVTLPLREIVRLPARAAAYEVARRTMQLLGRWANPLAWRSWRSATTILVQNEETKRWLPRSVRNKCMIFPNVVLEHTARHVPNGASEGAGSATACFVGRLLHWKGADMAVRAVAMTARWRLIVAGKGPEEPALRTLAAELDVTDRVSFLGEVERTRVWEVMQGSDVLLFPSTHDEGGWVVAEALSVGVPVVCVDRGGPSAIGGEAAVTVPLGADRDAVARALAEVLERRAFPTTTVAVESAQRFLIDRRAVEIGTLVEALRPRQMP